jgi:hypothetical protein
MAQEWNRQLVDQVGQLSTGVRPIHDVVLVVNVPRFADQPIGRQVPPELMV